MTTQTALRTRPLMPEFGAEILDVDVASADATTLARIVDVFNASGLILLRKQRLDKAQLVAFTSAFGDPAENTREEYTDPEYPKVYVISNKVVNNRAIGQHDDHHGWHSDLATAQRPALCTLLQALEVPDEGSDTLVADMCGALRALPAERQQEFMNYRVHQSFVEMRRVRGLNVTQEEMDAFPDVFHPMVRRHPVDGRKALFLGSMAVGIKGLPNPQGRELLKELQDFATQERFTYRHKWQVGDVLIWDNRMTLHTGTSYDMKKYTRHMHRTWVRGEVPLAA